MAKLTKTQTPVALTPAQTLVLEAAACRKDGTVGPPPRLKGKAADKLFAALIEKGLVREIRAKRDMPVWRHDAETGHGFAFAITSLGRRLARTSLTARFVAEELPYVEIAKVPSIGPVGASVSVEAQKVTTGTSAGVRTEVSIPESSIVAGPADPAHLSVPRPGSKLGEVIALLARERGAAIAEVMQVTGWLPHTTRAALTGLRKRGYDIHRQSGGEAGTLYRIVMADRARAA